MEITTVGLTETNKDNTDDLIIIGSEPNVICTSSKTQLQMDSSSTVWPRDRALYMFRYMRVGYSARTFSLACVFPLFV